MVYIKSPDGTSFMVPSGLHMKIAAKSVEPIVAVPPLRPSNLPTIQNRQRESTLKYVSRPNCTPILYIMCADGRQRHTLTHHRCVVPCIVPVKCSTFQRMKKLRTITLICKCSHASVNDEDRSEAKLCTTLCIFAIAKIRTIFGTTK